MRRHGTDEQDLEVVDSVNRLLLLLEDCLELLHLRLRHLVVEVRDSCLTRDETDKVGGFGAAAQQPQTSFGGARPTFGATGQSTFGAAPGMYTFTR